MELVIDYARGVGPAAVAETLVTFHERNWQRKEIAWASHLKSRLIKFMDVLAIVTEPNAPNTTLLVILSVISVLNCVNNLNLPFSGGIVNLLFLRERAFNKRRFASFFFFLSSFFFPFFQV